MLEYLDIWVKKQNPTFTMSAGFVRFIGILSLTSIAISNGQEHAKGCYPTTKSTTTKVYSTKMTATPGALIIMDTICSIR